ncbi:DUF475 domain-containing protein [Allostreptomyces psammosilenae]|uniref:DUF475 domain-containing protein n=1 Tax=Allostreptomyces psammosilenae TaxID=1892865 RepID=A0A852ZWY9_9ACTN|nr:DUF475 domain-containing protein [Allostreptomyces psammosilenae]NYI06719.1 hypothetical protein [Allostreptomyces psammosilenae]
MVVRTFGWSFAITAIGLIASYLLWGWQGFAAVAILSVLEISLSFDNAVVNATILKRMNPFWQRMFLTVGILIAVFGMRLVFPVLIVAITAGLGPIEAVRLAVDDPSAYEHAMEEAHPAIAAFGGMFLMMIFLNFIFEDREHRWLAPIERVTARIGGIAGMPIMVAMVALVIAGTTFATEETASTVMISGVLGLVTYLAVNGLSDFFEGQVEEQQEAEEKQEKSGNAAVVGLAGRAAFFLFMYLEVLDASFSFDGVVGAFAITNDIFEIALGLGIGAMYIRSITVYLVRQGTLDEYVYLEHGAHWAIGALAVLLLVTIEYEVPEVVTGLIGVGFILLALASSIVYNRRHRGGDGEGAAEDKVAATV